jgi:hypothetical protein
MAEDCPPEWEWVCAVGQFSEQVTIAGKIVGGITATAAIIFDGASIRYLIERRGRYRITAAVGSIATGVVLTTEGALVLAFTLRESTEFKLGAAALALGSTSIALGIWNALARPRPRVSLLPTFLGSARSPSFGIVVHGQL